MDKVHRLKTVRDAFAHDAAAGAALVVFDGTCNFCNGWTRFVIERDPLRQFRFAAAQSSTGSEVLASLGLSATDLETIVLVDGHRHYEKSDAVLRIVGRLRAYGLVCRVLLLVPRRLRDACYVAFARRRYAWFGRSDRCALLESDLADRFVS